MILIRCKYRGKNRINKLNQLVLIEYSHLY
uniref:Uncharacterized protein n=1 Tax=Siphoviridae sp. ct47y1 TaxID=2827775 RepID=A0A8S5T9Y1_9CAUD|nr:MAG TPA: hypothetical protein [Siphoviridae sp. ct47y1]DAI21134.1 MAG TPA: hypothetical protein [Caudoviricetes sp.]DAS29179.1 MAG TPA: hypothetical protein [Caudoviricetes sp.]